MNTFPTSPLSQYRLLASGDRDEVQSRVSDVFCPHQMQVVGPEQSVDTHLFCRRFRGVTLGRLSYGATVNIDPGRLDSFYLMQWPLRGGETVHVGRTEVRSTPQLGSLVNPKQRFHMRHEVESEKLFIRIDLTALQKMASQWDGLDNVSAIEFLPTVAFDSEALSSWKNLLKWLFDEASYGTLLDEPLLAPRVEETVLLSMLRLLPHNQPERMQTHQVLTPGFVRRALDYIEAHAHEPLTVALIAEVAGVSIRSLYAGFQRYRQCSPMAFLRSVRMNRVHEELQREHETRVTVTQAALRWGFGHLGQFSADYKAQYGELPSHTLLRASTGRKGVD